MKATIAIAVFCVVFAILGYTGIWVPNRFGTGTLWLFVGALTFVWGYNTYIDKKQKQEVKQ